MQGRENTPIVGRLTSSVRKIGPTCDVSNPYILPRSLERGIGDYPLFHWDFSPAGAYFLSDYKTRKRIIPEKNIRGTKVPMLSDEIIRFRALKSAAKFGGRFSNKLMP